MGHRGRRGAGPARGAGALNTRLRAVVDDRRVRLGAGALLLVVVIFAAGAFTGGWRPFATGVDVLSFGQGGDMARFALIEGECATGELGGTKGFSSDEDTPCGEPHDIEVVATRAPLEESRSSVYPGQAALARFGRAFCEIVADSDALEPEAGGVSKSDLTITAVIPSEAAFLAPRTADASSAGARQVTCVISRSGGDKLGDRFSVI